MRREWCGRNPVKLVEAQKNTRGRDFAAVAFGDSARLISASERHENCAAAVGLLVLAGIRPAGGRQAEMARHRPFRKHNHRKFALLENGRRKAGGNLPLAEIDTFGLQEKTRTENPPLRLAQKMARHQERVGAWQKLGSGRAKAHLRKLPRKEIRRPPATPTQHGAPRPKPAQKQICEHARTVEIGGEQFFRRFFLDFGKMW